MILMMIVVSD